MADEPAVTVSESADEELARLRRLATADDLLTALVGTLDIREMFTRVSEVVGRVLTHDAISLPVVTDDGEHILVFAMAGPAPGTTPGVHPIPEAARHLFTDRWDFEIVDDMLSEPERHPFNATLGFRSMLRVPIRLQERVVALLVVLSRQPGVYQPPDAVVVGRIANYIALALSHQRLAEQARLAEELRARAAALELVDDLLATFVDTREPPEVFGRISAIARRVLAHDALVLTLALPDGKRASVYASSGVDGKPFPEVFDLPEDYVRDAKWDEVIAGDLPTHPVFQTREAARRGYRSALRLAIRVEGKLAGALLFFSFTPAAYKDSDLLVARRLRDRLALYLTQGQGAELAKRAAEATERAVQLERRVRALTDELNACSGYRRVVGNSPLWHQALTQAAQVAGTDTTVLLLGESGTGKEVVARFIHRGSTRRDRPFLALNCAALPEQLLEAELFGYERGAFTGATQSKPGQLEQAAGGILFLDEVAEMSVSAQAKFLRVLQEREFQRLGGTRVIKADARIVAATNRDLQKAMERGTFRADLYYRLNVFAIRLPPLRDRIEDVLPLTEAFIQEIGRSIGRPPAGISREARDALLGYSWPGNVRELRNILERAAILCDGGLITAGHLAIGPSSVLASPAVSGQPVATASPSAPPVSSNDLRSIERALIAKALADAHNNKSQAATALGLTRAQLYVRLRKHGLDKIAGEPL
jgi:transcriptional regulator with GAF, ATPase, and Fis domain